MSWCVWGVVGDGGGQKMNGKVEYGGKEGGRKEGGKKEGKSEARVRSVQWTDSQIDR